MREGAVFPFPASVLACMLASDFSLASEFTLGSVAAKELVDCACAGGECLIGESAEKTAARFVWLTPRAASKPVSAIILSRRSKC